MLEVEEEHVAGLTVREAVLKETRLAVEVGERVAEHGVDALATAFGGRVADLRVLRKVVEVAVGQERVDSRLLAERVDRVLVGRRQQRLADVKQEQLDVGVLAARQQVLNESHLQVAIARAERDHLERTLSTGLDHPTGQFVERVLGAIRRHKPRLVAHRDIGQRAPMFQIGVGLFDVTAGAVEHSDVLLEHPQWLVAGRNVAVETAVRRLIGRCAKLRRVAKHILPSKR